jgi:hypothetical protein
MRMRVEASLKLPEKQILRLEPEDEPEMNTPWEDGPLQSHISRKPMAVFRKTLSPKYHPLQVIDSPA